VNIFTFGYGGRQVATLAAFVAEFHAVVIDVRLKPWTKQPGWSLSDLKAVFAEEYHWWGRSLGDLNFKGGTVKLADEKKGMKKLVALMRAAGFVESEINSFEASPWNLYLVAEREPESIYAIGKKEILEPS